MPLVRFLVITVAFALSGGAYASDIALPNWSSDQIRAARSLALEDALVFDLTATISTKSAAVQTRHRTVTLGRTFTLIAGEDQNSLYDHELCRALSWKPGKSDLVNESCFSGPAFRVLEIRNRQVLREVTAKVGLKTPVADTQPYWAEVELGVQVTSTSPLTKRAAGEAIEYRLGDDIVARFSGSATSLNPDEDHRFARFLALGVQLHPQLRHDLAAGAVAPERMEFKTYQANEPQSQVLVISNVRRGQVAYPLPAGLRSQIDQDASSASTPKQRGLHQAILAAEGKSQIAKPTAQALVGSMRTAVASGRSMAGLFVFFELTQQYSTLFSGDPAGQPMLAELRPLAQKIVNDPTVQPFWNASQLAGSGSMAGDRQQAAKYLANARFDDLPFGTFRYVTFANLISISGDTSKWDPGIFKTMPKPLDDGYWIHIAAYPWSSFAFKDAGDYYLRGYDTPEAWQAYDLGRAVDPNWRQGPMGGLAKFEDQLRAGEPDFF